MKTTTALVFFGCVSFAPHASAFVHVVGPGETLAQIAQRAYGDAQLESVLVGANALDVQGGSAIVAGMRIEIPAPGHRRVVDRESWAEIALTFLGDAKRADVLARANHAVSWIPPVGGQEIVIPAVLAHIAAEGESTATLARRYLNDMNRSWELDAYNFRKPNALRRGEVMLIPLVDLTLTEQGKAEARRAGERAVSEGGGVAHDSQRRADLELPQLLAHVRGGRYVDALALGNRLLGSGDLTRTQLAMVHRALLEAYVALEASGAAAGACAAWRLNDGVSAVDKANPQPAGSRLDPRLTSPKIRAACEL